MGALPRQGCKSWTSSGVSGQHLRQPGGVRKSPTCLGIQHSDGCLQIPMESYGHLPIVVEKALEFAAGDIWQPKMSEGDQGIICKELEANLSNIQPGA